MRRDIRPAQSTPSGPGVFVAKPTRIRGRPGLKACACTGFHRDFSLSAPLGLRLLLHPSHFHPTFSDALSVSAFTGDQYDLFIGGLPAAPGSRHRAHLQHPLFAPKESGSRAFSSFFLCHVVFPGPPRPPGGSGHKGLLGTRPLPAYMPQSTPGNRCRVHSGKSADNA